MICSNVLIDKLSSDFKGIVTVNDELYYLDNVVKGDVVTFNFDLKTKKVTSLKIVKPSNTRIKPICPIFNKCGGCKFLHINYDEQLSMKTEFVENLFFDKYKTYFNVTPTIGMDDPFRYRNKNQIAFKNVKGGKCRIASGFYQEGTHNLVDFETCYLQDEISDKIVATIKGLMLKMHYNAFDEDKGYGLIRHVLIKRSKVTKEIMVVVVTGQEVFPGSQNFVKALIAKHKDISTIIQNINPKKTNAVLGEKEKVLYGKGYITDILMGKKFKVSSKSFYQINSLQCEQLYSNAIKLAGLKKTDILLDAYCGVGTIGIIASDYVNKVIGVELVKEAVNDAIFNAKVNKIKNIHFFCDDATKFISNVAARKEKIDVIIMDPPRKGSDKKFINACLKLKPAKIIYISCNPITQVEDIEGLLANGYKVTKIQPVDMFPHTQHVESIVVLSKK